MDGPLGKLNMKIWLDLPPSKMHGMAGQQLGNYQFDAAQRPPLL